MQVLGCVFYGQITALSYNTTLSSYDSDISCPLFEYIKF